MFGLRLKRSETEKLKKKKSVRKLSRSVFLAGLNVDVVD